MKLYELNAITQRLRMQVCSFFYRGKPNLRVFVKFIPKYVILFDAIVKVTVSLILFLDYSLLVYRNVVC